MISMILFRSDAGDGGWSLHPGDASDDAIASGEARILAAGDAEMVDGAWNRPNPDDCADALLALGPNGCFSISIDVVYGARSVDEEDRDRARAAAATVLNQAGLRAADAYAEYRSQWSQHEDNDLLTGAAAVWHAAEMAADLALTKGWLNPDGASCTISA